MLKQIIEIYDNGDRFYYDSDHTLHREEGPAIEGSNGVKKWFKHGFLHRLDGPAEIFINYEKYWIEGICYTKKDFLAKTSKTCDNKIEIDGKKYKLILLEAT